jgi:hypothetical protein
VNADDAFDCEHTCPDPTDPTTAPASSGSTRLPAGTCKD